MKVNVMVLSAFCAVGWASPEARDTTIAEPLGLDHVPIAVRDLDAAIRAYRDDLGFSIKPGRLHPNSIDNAHLKFEDGTELELITAVRPVDNTAAEYIRYLARGEGAAFLSLHAGSIDSTVTEPIRRAGFRFDIVNGPYYRWLTFPGGPLDYVFFGWIAQPPVDLPEHLRHRNTAIGMHAVWLKKSDFEGEERLLRALNVSGTRRRITLVDGEQAEEIRLARGGLYLIKSDNPSMDDRPIVGVTLEVADFDAAARAVGAAFARGVAPDFASAGTDERGRFLRVPPVHTHGIWLELLQVARRN